MSCNLSIDCLNEIFEYLEDRVDLYSCLLVNRSWCQVSVRILWRSIQNYHTLIACLSDESKATLRQNDIITFPSTSKPPLFNYVQFIKNLSINEIVENIQPIVSQNLESHQTV